MGTWQWRRCVFDLVHWSQPHILYKDHSDTWRSRTQRTDPCTRNHSGWWILTQSSESLWKTTAAVGCVITMISDPWIQELQTSLVLLRSLTFKPMIEWENQPRLNPLQIICMRRITGNLVLTQDTQFRSVNQDTV